jgi:tripartite-type tricarboxylate transporter receptor subunit TctC
VAKHIGRCLLALFAALYIPSAAAQLSSGASDWPNRAIRFVVPLPPAGAYDFVARLMASRLQPVFGVPILVENKSGAGARIGTESVARAAPDGYTFLVMASTHTIVPSMVLNLPYDAVKDFEPVSLIVDSPFVLAVSPSMPVKNAQEFVALARSKPGAIEYGTSGVGSPFHLAGELLKMTAGINMLHVPYKGTGPLMAALLGGEVQVGLVPLGPYLPYFRSGKLLPLAVADKQRTPLLPDLPTIAEAVPLPGFGLGSWIGMAAPAGTPKAIVERMSAEIRKVLQDPETRDSLLSQGYVPVGSTPAELAQVIEEGIATSARIVRDAKIPRE